MRTSDAVHVPPLGSPRRRAALVLCAELAPGVSAVSAVISAVIHRNIKSCDYLRPARPDTQPARTTHPRITAAYSHHTSTTHTHAPNPTNHLTNRQKQPDNTGPKGKKTHNTAHQKDDEGNAPSRESENGTKVARLMRQSSR